MSFSIAYPHCVHLEEKLTYNKVPAQRGSQSREEHNLIVIHYNTR